MPTTSNSPSLRGPHAGGQAGAAKHVQHAAAPLGTLNLLLAGVPVREVLWYRGLAPADKMIALRGTRGGLLLEKVRAHQAGSAGMAVAA